MDPIKDAIDSVLKGLKEKSPPAKDLETLCRGVFAPRERQHLRPRGVSKATLWILVDSPAWMYHLNLRREELLKKFNALGAGIKELRFAVGEIGRPCKRRD